MSALAQPATARIAAPQQHVARTHRSVGDRCRPAIGILILSSPRHCCCCFGRSGAKRIAAPRCLAWAIGVTGAASRH